MTVGSMIGSGKWHGICRVVAAVVLVAVASTTIAPEHHDHHRERECRVEEVHVRAEMWTPVIMPKMVTV